MLTKKQVNARAKQRNWIQRQPDAEKARMIAHSQFLARRRQSKAAGVDYPMVRTTSEIMGAKSPKSYSGM